MKETFTDLGAFVAHENIFISGRPGGPLDGLRFAVKDLFDIEGHVTGCGNPDWLNRHGAPDSNAPVVQQLVEAGATMIAKTDTIKSPKNLIGLKVCVATASSKYPGFRVFAMAQGIDMKKRLKLVPIGLGVTPLLAKQVDAMLAFTMNQPLSAADKEINVGEMLLSDYGVKMYGLVLTTPEDLLQKDPTTARGFLRASLRGIRRAASHRDEERVAALKEVVPQAN